MTMRATIYDYPFQKQTYSYCFPCFNCAGDAGVFKNLSVTRKTTGDHPLFLERSICKAMGSAFPGGGRLSCTRHLQGNAQEYLKDKVGLLAQTELK